MIWFFKKKNSESDDITQTRYCQEISLCHKCRILFWGLMVSANQKPPKQNPVWIA